METEKVQTLRLVGDGRGDLWDAHAEIALGQFISRHLAACPPPADSELAADLIQWGENLLRCGQERLEALPPRPRVAAG